MQRPLNLITCRYSNPGSSVLLADAMTTMPRMDNVLFSELCTYIYDTTACQRFPAALCPDGIRTHNLLLKRWMTTRPRADWKEPFYYWLLLITLFLHPKYFFKGCPGWGANPGSFDFVYFLIPSLYRWATEAPPPPEVMNQSFPRRVPIFHRAATTFCTLCWNFTKRI
jgi:hypothetical protein